MSRIFVVLLSLPGAAHKERGVDRSTIGADDCMLLAEDEDIVVADDGDLYK